MKRVSKAFVQQKKRVDLTRRRRCWMRTISWCDASPSICRKAALQSVCSAYQQILHRNIVYLGTIADASTEILPETQTSDDTAN
ncbi:SS18-like protein 2 isoform X2 [Carassius auratus]|uniref:SS18-like protein 2 isoform X2 n=1 Tax=Carassius auratus TaxID=7957 RepID=A0A6P6LP14_CARAU|nr:SS18-like protein 2 isoform X2 [Carassius auratus]